MVGRFALGIGLTLALAPAAQASKVLITDATAPNFGVTVLDTSTNTFTRPPAFQTGPTEGGGQIALAPDATRAWTGTAGGGPVVRLDLVHNAVFSPSFPVAGNGTLAANPAASRLFAGTPVANVIPLDSATGTPGTPVVGGGPTSDVIIDPSGNCGYASTGASGSITVFSAATGTTCPASFALPGGGGHFSFTPDGSQLVVAENGGSDTAVVNVNSAGPAFTAVPGFTAPRDVAVTPSGNRAYVVDGGATQQLRVVSLGATPTAGTAIPLTGLGINGGQSIAISADGRRAYVPSVSNDKVAVVDLTSDAQIDTLTRPSAATSQDVAVVPDQGPRADFTPHAAPAGSATVLDGSASSDSDGSVARYDWDFGDGTTLADGGPTPAHVYSAPGIYSAVLVATDNEGVSVQRIWTGVPKTNPAGGFTRVGFEVPPPTPAGTTGVRPRASFAGRAVKIGRSGRGRVKMLCSAAPGDRCAIAGQLTARIAVGARKRKKKTLQIGSLNGTVSGGARGDVTIVLSARGKKAVRGGRKVTAAARGTSTDRSGARENFTGTLRLSGPKSKKR